jgi:predicted RNA-binding Zn-ribbon protein involved in translation (DUF1610 family)
MDSLERMFHTLVRTLRVKQPALLNAPFTVGELHQQILPYRHFRRELQLETNQEYELVLMELLAGARGYLDVDEQLRDRLGKELQSSSPEPSRVREFADANVSINSAAQTRVPVAVPTPASQQTVPTRPSAPLAEAAADGSRCRYCGGDLPEGRVMNYCPHCGQNLQVLNCSACGAEVEAGWKFCVSCGKAVA